MTNCSPDCSEGIYPSKCVEFNSELSVYDSLTAINLAIKDLNFKFTNKIDGKTLGTGQDLINTIQKLVDLNITSSKNTDNIQELNIDLMCLSDSCNVVINQQQLNSLLIKEICYLKGVINSLQTNY